MSEPEQGADGANQNAADEQAERWITFIRLEIERALKRESRRKRAAEEIWSSNYRRSEKIGALAGALAKAQGAFTVVKRANTANIETKREGASGYGYKYAELGDFIEMARAPLASVGLAVLQFPSWNEDGTVSVETMLVHGESEQWMANDFYLRPKDNNPQSIGSAVTYCRRYAYTAILGMISDREDDDGNAAQGRRARFERNQKGQPQQAWGNYDESPYGDHEPPPPGPPDDYPQQQAPNRAQGAPTKPAPTTPPQQTPKPPTSEGRPKPGLKGPDDLKRGLEAIQTDYPQHYDEAVEALVNGYGAERHDPSAIATGSYEAAYEELTKLYRTLRRAAGRNG